MNNMIHHGMSNQETNNEIEHKRQLAVMLDWIGFDRKQYNVMASVGRNLNVMFYNQDYFEHMLRQKIESDIKFSQYADDKILRIPQGNNSVFVTFK